MLSELASLNEAASIGLVSLRKRPISYHASSRTKTYLHCGPRKSFDGHVVHYEHCSVIEMFVHQLHDYASITRF